MDALTLNQSFNDLLATTDTSRPFMPFGNSVGLVNTTVSDNLNYRFDLSPSLWVEPTVAALYTNSSHGAGAAQLGLATGNLVRVQGGAPIQAFNACPFAGPARLRGSRGNRKPLSR